MIQTSNILKTQPHSVMGVNMKVNNTTRTINIFRTGTFTDMRGRTHTYSERDLDMMATVYNSGRKRGYNAPLCLGHPASNHPQYGETNALISRGGKLYATVTPDENLTGLVRSRAYKKISASFFMPHHKDNPYPGSWMLRHIGFLGAQPPAVKGLEEFLFSEACELSFFTYGTGTADFSDYVNPSDTDPQNIVHHVTQDISRTMNVSYCEALNIFHQLIWSN
ncbi:hypothetical protein AABH71_003150 [Salmonella enterica]|uniref:Uncharacterized protein n=1 Tax=Salmonella enterica I TaxID=59201 RepID=A0A3R1BVD2_SALET|nr:hypothetical protein [Salmonella enterica subsp. enterica serovar Kokomlemle]EEB7409768.1 hypothetical protein [Salmonella enterica]EGJ5834693.1 hypothetical protein [Salmonella enterica]MML55210.1 hypothetical protein [Salmonella enterica subsp. enterica serovar Kidderminster]